jgi:glutathione synthase/RimK-type ligase-like ATP-grasp enzyme
MARQPITVLLTCGGGPGTIVHGIALKKAAGYDVRVVMADSNPASGNLFLPWVDARYRIPSYTSDDFVPALLRLIQREKVGLIYSGLDEELSILSRSASQFSKHGCSLLLPPADVLETALDKLACHDKLQQHIRMPGTWRLSNIHDVAALYNELDGRVILKVSASRGGRHIYMADSLKEFLCYVDLARRLECDCGQPFMIQEYIKGTEYNVSSLHDASGKLIYAVCRRKFENRLIKSSTTAAAIEKNDAVIAMALKSIDMLDLRPGFNNVEIIIGDHDKQPYLLEINGGRTAAQDMNLLAAGINFSEMLIDITHGRNVAAVSHPQNGKAILKIRTDVVVDLEDIDAVPLA